MSELTITTGGPVGALAAPARTGAVSRAVRNVVVLTRRNLVHIAREPLQLSDITVQPVLFTLLFVYVLGGGVSVTGGDYKDFAIPGLVALNLTTSAMGTAVGLSNDLRTGAVNRFRTLPMWRAAVLVSRSLSDVLAAAVCMSIVLLTGLAIGWRPETSVAGFVGALAIPLLFSYALAWGTACLGMVSEGPESAQSIALVLLFPLAIVSNAMVPTAGMPGVVRAIAEWNPVSAVTAAARDLFGNPNPSAASHAWPMQHPVLAAVLWSVAIVAVCAPLAVALYRRRTTD
ncbi:ABC transporter [Frankia sp. CcI49]|uniref:Transport permease protein n=1 Tax=Parafrankia irregularis TaxID=795642 RepID=A0A0S4QPN7_9ACTN|nr:MULTISPECIES: ABC transporter permease [Frankiaceae]KPM51597.1 ABC transporter [Frankia sp. R43]MBE3201114.1 ABC transporter permease [Parafrankia sp. CH37]ONH59218.1 ABC transporter [Frankia sp. CcI49]CUU56458.1 ABC transporter efflux protein, DrrB family [Parafrankia irregularis]